MKAINCLAERLRTETAVIMTHDLYDDIAALFPKLWDVVNAARGFRPKRIMYGPRVEPLTEGEHAPEQFIQLTLPLSSWMALCDSIAKLDKEEDDDILSNTHT